jgi:hypothetical protein
MSSALGTTTRRDLTGTPIFFAKPRWVAQDPESKDVPLGAYSHRDSMNKPIRGNWTAGDISGYGFAFALVLLATILSAYTDHPAFWLLIGTGPLVMALTLIAFLRHLFSVRRGLTNDLTVASRWRAKVSSKP